MGQVSGIRFALTGAILIAISFELARFAFGLFVPQIRADLEISANTTGVIAALSVPAVLFLVGAWRYAYLSFTVVAIIGVLLAWFLIPSVSRLTPSNAAPPPKIKARQ